MGDTLAFRQEIDGSSRDARLGVDTLVIAGWTGRDEAALEAHIAELEAMGVARPAATPCFYRVAASLLTTAGAIQVAGAGTSGEVEAVLFSAPDGLWVGVGSDHTDRETEAYNVTVSKQACAKPVAPVLWPRRRGRPLGRADAALLRGRGRRPPALSGGPGGGHADAGGPDRPLRRES